MKRAIAAAPLALLHRIEHGLDWTFGTDANPLYQLGALSFLCFWIATVTGIYLFVFFDTSVADAYASVERLTVEQWWLGGVIRSLHRYASALMAITVTLHLLRELILGRFRAARAFSWISGVPLLWLLFAAAIGGYILVWDRLAQYAAIATAEWLDWLPIFGDPLARNFFRPGTLSDRLFSLLVFLHIAIPLFLLVGMSIHIRRLKLARMQPSARLAAGTCVVLVAAALIRPATSMPPADLTRAPSPVNLDWVYLNVYPLLDTYGPGAVWALLGGVTLLLVLLPRLAPRRAPAPQPAAVDPDNCNGCTWCFRDCPFEAITMVPHEYKPGMRQARVNADLCTGCGICVGACPSATPFRRVDELVSGIEIPDYPVERLRRETLERLSRLPASGGTLVFGCDHAADVSRLAARADPAAAPTATLSLPCIALLPPSFVDWAARQPQVARVMITGCHPDDCYHRKGSAWTAARLDGSRDPHLRTTRARERIVVQWAGPRELPALIARLNELDTHASPYANGTAAEEPAS
ncbi:MAG TPA: cytochrome b N-terminal domain-containing protein [Pseudomonadales bacterium]